MIKIIFMSPLRNKLINTDPGLVENVIPHLATFRALLKIRDILQVKADEKKELKASGKSLADLKKSEGEAEDQIEESKTPEETNE